MYVEYTSNNSGGDWWLKSEDWKALEDAGWKVAWFELSHVSDNNGKFILDPDGTPKLVKTNGEDDNLSFLDSKAVNAYRTGLSITEAIAEWESATKSSSMERGCRCCGAPHRFTEYNESREEVSCGPDFL